MRRCKEVEKEKEKIMMDLFIFCFLKTSKMYVACRAYVFNELVCFMVGPPVAIRWLLWHLVPLSQ
jgi:hypothetical protein